MLPCIARSTPQCSTFTLVTKKENKVNVNGLGWKCTLHLVLAFDYHSDMYLLEMLTAWEHPSLQVAVFRFIVSCEHQVERLDCFCMSLGLAEGSTFYSVCFHASLSPGPAHIIRKRPCSQMQKFPYVPCQQPSFGVVYPLLITKFLTMWT